MASQAESTSRKARGDLAPYEKSSPGITLGKGRREKWSCTSTATSPPLRPPFCCWALALIVTDFRCSPTKYPPGVGCLIYCFTPPLDVPETYRRCLECGSERASSAWVVCRYIYNHIDSTFSWHKILENGLKRHRRRTAPHRVNSNQPNMASTGGDDHASRATVVFAVTIAMIVCSTVFVFFRMISRAAIVKRISVDDYFILLAWVWQFVWFCLNATNNIRFSPLDCHSPSATVPLSASADMRLMFQTHGKVHSRSRSTLSRFCTILP